MSLPQIDSIGMKSFKINGGVLLKIIKADPRFIFLFIHNRRVKSLAARRKRFVERKLKGKVL